MDEFKLANAKDVAIGGWKCSCCGPRNHDEKRKLHRTARRRLEQELIVATKADEKESPNL